MKKKVSELTAEEFQKTFPITLEEHNPDYADWYEAERQRILRAVDRQDVVRINHIGSTAVEGLVAKPIVDILLEMDGCCNVTRLLERLRDIGFGVEISTRRDDPLRLLLGKGMSCDGYADKVYLLHVRYAGNWSELYFGITSARTSMRRPNMANSNATYSGTLSVGSLSGCPMATRMGIRRQSWPLLKA